MRQSDALGFLKVEQQTIDTCFLFAVGCCLYSLMSPSWEHVWAYVCSSGF